MHVIDRYTRMRYNWSKSNHRNQTSLRLSQKKIIWHTIYVECGGQDPTCFFFTYSLLQYLFAFLSHTNTCTNHQHMNTDMHKLFHNSINASMPHKLEASCVNNNYGLIYVLLHDYLGVWFSIFFGMFVHKIEKTWSLYSQVIMQVQK